MNKTPENCLAIEEQLAKAGLSHTALPDKAAVELHYMLCERLRQQISHAGGFISFDQFMQSALYEPGLGYYVTAMNKFGRQGDFVTAPEISEVFGYCLANQCQEIISQLESGPEPVNILEIGAGSGKLAVDIMSKLEQESSLPHNYLLLETSPDLQQRQQQLISSELPHLQSRFHWLKGMPDNFTGVIVANELLDAMPVRRFIVTEQGVREAGVSWQNNGFMPQSIAAAAELSEYVANLAKKLDRAFVTGYESEVNWWLKPWIKTVAGSLRQGVVLLIDYGYPASEYYHEQRVDGTLICNYRHQAHANPYLLAGLQDISAFVDFSAVAEYASSSEMQIAGFCSQAQFLLANGLDKIAENVLLNTPEKFPVIAQGIKRLTLPGDMGERFKVLGLGKKYAQPLRGFSGVNQIYRL